MPALERVRGWRVVAAPAALDSAIWNGEAVVVLRFAPDEAFGLGAISVEVDEPGAIVVAEAGFVGARLSEADLVDVIAHLDWALPADAGVLAQGKIGGVPAKLMLGNEPLLLTHAAYASELAQRLGWRP